MLKRKYFARRMVILFVNMVVVIFHQNDMNVRIMSNSDSSVKNFYLCEKKTANIITLEYRPVSPNLRKPVD